MKIGVLALQGDFYLHQKMLDRLGVEAAAVKTPQDLQGCRGLIIPGGESTTLVKLLKHIKLYEQIRVFNRDHPIFGTCAGAILVSSQVSNHPVEPLGLIDIAVERNAYGTQIDSFIDRIDFRAGDESVAVEGVFIRAPKIIRVGEGVRSIAFHKNDVVMVESERVLAATFHPELSESMVIHEYFLNKISG